MIVVKYTGWLERFVVKTKVANYIFTTDRRKQYVDALDKDVFENMVYDGMRVFECLK